uniref:RNI-like protein n=1 Tax=Helicotheca tamesis TaxID=374047 RepID=A0A7S2IB54_9STRA|eukprot:CAMPEP_0185739060 /NCGR_PEP_ID=MMETSP1171-20130828/34500_1 /TAXON_ID=374046 /ORGANISM="Helicotheca tamensis, Strain CCMP826" /LENGTH=289 /DNA_ID=CAMNT_0028410499 /DNA_START=53 /DNA_END=922 /DNA_ORIENTATION=-
MAPLTTTSLTTLRSIRQYDPYLQQNLPPTPNNDTSTTSYQSNTEHVQFDTSGNITYLNLGGRRLRKLPSPISTFHPLEHLTTLNLGNSDLPPQIQMDILSSLKQHGTLRDLHLSGNGLRDAGITNLSAVLEDFESLEKLDLRYNDIGPAGATSLGTILNSSKNKLRILHVEGNELGDEGVTSLATVLCTNQTLMELYLGSNSIGPNGATSLSKCIEVNRTLSKLHLEGNCIGPNGAIAFAEVLERLKVEGGMRGLEKLYVDNNEMGKDAAKRLAKALNSDTAIEAVMEG